MDNTEAVAKLEDIVLEHEDELYSADITAEAILAAFQAAPLEFVKPKPLEWVEGKAFVHNWLYYETLPQLEEGGYFLLLNARTLEPSGSTDAVIFLAKHPTLKAAHSAAETHRNEMLAKEFE